MKFVDGLLLGTSNFVVALSTAMRGESGSRVRQSKRSNEHFFTRKNKKQIFNCIFAVGFMHVTVVSDAVSE